MSDQRSAGHGWDNVPVVGGSATVREVPPQLARYRSTIDNLDAALVHLLAERFRCTQQVGHLKAELDLPPADPEREARQIARLRALAHESGLDPVFAEKFFSFIVAEVIHHHEQIRIGGGQAR
ncbi:chorismate mutase [Actinomyces bowdenii]|uniref:Chorismate mutase n=1 Tax=Actinomyces bowdenii TaxID=131109 RepID=A0A3P1V8T2_9ACTO|nr:chorismate mutase [Actinomyces bowdenii]MBO3723803.1 chorismate mutase [Actinomyces bowdenii]RRD29900.1 chorismate mutase [Actinomyces bowdenii]